MGHIPLIRRNGFIYSFLTLLVLYGVFLLPASGPPAASDLGVIVLFASAADGVGGHRFHR